MRRNLNAVATIVSSKFRQARAHRRLRRRGVRGALTSFRILRRQVQVRCPDCCSARNWGDRSTCHAGSRDRTMSRTSHSQHKSNAAKALIQRGSADEIYTTVASGMRLRRRNRGARTANSPRSPFRGGTTEARESIPRRGFHIRARTPPPRWSATQTGNESVLPRGHA